MPIGVSRVLEVARQYLWPDATYFIAHQGGRIINLAVIIGEAVNQDGKREALRVARGPFEADSFWTEVLCSLFVNGGDKAEKSSHDREFGQLREDMKAIIQKLDSIEQALRK
jgi:transposase-like protein